MADEQSKLQIIIEAINQTGDPFKQFASALDTLAQSATESSRAVKDAFSGLTQTADEMSSAVARDMDAAAKSVSDSATGMESMQKTASELSQSVGESFSNVSKSADEMNSEIAKDMDSATKAVSEFEKSAATDLAGASKEMDSLRSNMNKGIDQIGGLIAIQMLGQSMEELGKKGEHLFDYAVEQGSDFQQNMKNIQTVIAANADGAGSWQDKLQSATGSADQLQQKALELGSRGAQSANQVAEAMDAMLRSGVDANTVLNGAAESAQNVAIVTGDKLDESANLVTEIYHQFRESFASNGKSMQENMKTTGDVLTGTLLSARISSQDFLDTLKYVGPVASQLGSSFTDAATATALLAQNGIKGSQAGNNLKRAMTNLLEPTKQGAKAMEELGLLQNGHNKLIDETTGKMKNLTDIQNILHSSMEGLTEVKKAQLIHDIFGQYALAGTLVLANENSEAFAKMKEKIGNVSAEQAAASMLDTFSGHMAQLRAHVQTTAKEFGMAFLPVLERLIPIGQTILNWFQELTPANKEFLMAILAVGSGVAVVGGALATFAISAKFASEGMAAIKSLFMIQAEGEVAISVFKKFAMAVKEVGVAEAFMDLMSPVAWIAVAVAAVIGLAVVIMQHWGPIKDFLSKLWTEISTETIKVWNDIGNFFNSLWTGIKNTTTTVWNSIKTFAETTWNNIIDGIVSTWNGFIKWISTAAHAAVQWVVDAFDWMYNHNYYFKNLTDFIQKAWDTIKKDAEEMWGKIKEFFDTVWSDITTAAQTAWDTFTTKISDIWNGIETVANTIWNPIKDFFSGIWNSIETTFSQLWGSVRSTMSNAWNETVNDGESIFNGMGTFFTGLWNDALNWGGNLVHMVAKGIEDAAQEVADAAKNVAGKIASFLGFHSPTESGPGADADQWAPNFIKMFANGLSAGAPQIAGAAQALISPLSDTFNGLTGGSVGVGVSSVDPANVDKIKAAVNAIIQAKNEYAIASQHNDQKVMFSAHAAADRYRDILKQMGVDTTAFAADKSIPDAMQGLQKVMKQVADSVQNNYKTMTTDLKTNNADISLDTMATHGAMDFSWNDMSQKVSDTAMKLRDSVTNVFKSMTSIVTVSWNAMTQKIADATKDLRDMIANLFRSLTSIVSVSTHEMQNVIASSFDRIAVNAEQTASRVVSAVSQIKDAMAAIGGGNSSLGVSSSYGYAPMDIASPMLPIIGGSRSSVVNHIVVNANGNIVENEQHLGNVVSKALYDKMKMQGKVE